MHKTIRIRVMPDLATNPSRLRRYVAREEAIDARTINALLVRRRSIDARQRIVCVEMELDLYVNEEPPLPDFSDLHYPQVGGCPRVLVVGAGPGGLFAALRLIELGYCPVVLERGKDVHARHKDIARISREHHVDPESNYAFGEGGAGAFSDGKLYTRSRKRGSVERVLRVFCRHGASPDILVDAHPHIGTDRLPRVVEAIRETIIQSGGEVHFSTRVDALLRTSDGTRVVGGTTSAGKEFHGPVILATGHSARDVYRYLHAEGIPLVPKGIAVGVRLEHPSALIDRIQYHNPAGRGEYLPAAEYSYTAQVDGRGVYSFCMCPGGFIVPAATSPEQVVVNGMSPANRGSAWSNAGMVVATTKEDLDGGLAPFMQEALADEDFAASHGDYPAAGPLRLMYFQEALERQAWLQGQRRQAAPAQRMTDFVSGRLSYDLPRSSYSPGLVSSPLHFWMPESLVSRLRAAFSLFGRRSRGFLTSEAVVVAAETRTSSPVRIVRDATTLAHPSVEGLFPCGEGAGYAGGIVSSAIDGMRCAEAAAAWLASQPAGRF